MNFKNCPVCDISLKGEEESCQQCGSDLQVFLTVEALRSEFKPAGGQGQEVAQSIVGTETGTPSIQSKIDKLENESLEKIEQKTGNWQLALPIAICGFFILVLGLLIFRIEARVEDNYRSTLRELEGLKSRDRASSVDSSESIASLGLIAKAMQLLEKETEENSRLLKENTSLRKERDEHLESISGLKSRIAGLKASASQGLQLKKEEPSS